MAQLGSPPGGAQVLSPHNRRQPRASAALRKQAPVETTSTFVPLLDWTEDRQLPEALHTVKPAAASPQGVQSRSTGDFATSDADAESSDASISSSDNEIYPGSQSRQRARRPQREAQILFKQNGRHLLLSTIVISSSTDTFLPNAHVFGGAGRSADANRLADTSQSVQQTAGQTAGSAALPALFKPGQGAAAGKAPHRAAEKSQPADFHTGVGANADQLRSQQLKLKQAAVKAENELERLKSLLQREQALQVLCSLEL